MLNVSQRHRRRANISPALVQSIGPYRQHAGTFCMYVADDRSGRHKRSPGVGTVLAHSLQHWIGAVPALVGRISCFVVMTMGAIAQ